MTQHEQQNLRHLHNRARAARYLGGHEAALWYHVVLLPLPLLLPLLLLLLLLHCHQAAERVHGQCYQGTQAILQQD